MIRTIGIGGSESPGIGGLFGAGGRPSPGNPGGGFVHVVTKPLVEHVHASPKGSTFESGF